MRDARAWLLSLAPALAGALAAGIVSFALAGAVNWPIVVAMAAGFLAAGVVSMATRRAPAGDWAVRSQFSRAARIVLPRRADRPTVSFGRFDDRAKRVLALAQEEAVRFNHNYIGPEHILLGLVREGEGVGARVLGNLGVEIAKVRTAVEMIIGRGEATSSPSEIALTPRTKKVIELAIDEARTLGVPHVGTEHLLLGLVRDGGSVATGILESLGLGLTRVREAVLKELSRPPSATPGGPAAAVPGSKPRASGSREFDRFDDSGKRVLALAQDEAISFNHNYIGTEHLLLGLVREGGVAARVLGKLGVELSKVHTALEHIIGRGEAATSPSEITLSPRTKNVIELAIDEAGRRGDLHVGSEHLLLGLLREGEGIGSGILESLGLGLTRVREALLEELGRPPDAKGG